MGGLEGSGLASLRVTKHPSIHLQPLKPLANLSVDPRHPEWEGSVPLPLAAAYPRVQLGSNQAFSGQNFQHSKRKKNQAQSESGLRSKEGECPKRQGSELHR